MREDISRFRAPSADKVRERGSLPEGHSHSAQRAAKPHVASKELIPNWDKYGPSRAFMTTATRAYENDTCHRLIVESLHIPALPDRCRLLGQPRVAIPTAPFSGGTYGVQRCGYVNRKPFRNGGAIQNFLPSPPGIFQPWLETQ